MNPYEVLGVSTRDSQDTIKSKYRKLCKMYHPDNSVSGDAYKLNEIIKAYEILKEQNTSDKYIWCHKTLFTLKRRKL